MLKENIMFGIRKMKQQLSNTVFIILGLGITIATIVLLYTILVTNENPNNKFKDAERIVINRETMRYREGSDSNSSLNFMMIKQVIETIDLFEANTIYSQTTHQRWVNDERYKSWILYTDHRMERFINFDWIDGGFFTEDDYEGENRVILLSRKSAMATFGSVDVVGKTCDVFDEKFRVIGVYENLPEHTFSMDEIVPLTLDSYKERAIENKEAGYYYSSLGMAKSVNDIPVIKQMVHENGKQFEIFPKNMKLALYPHTIKDNLYTDRKHGHGKPWSKNSGTYANFINSVILISILAIICFVNVVNLTLTSFLNRNIEIGVRLSFGASWIDIVRQAFIESLLFFGMSLCVGLLFSQAFISIVNYLEVYKNYHFMLSTDTVLIIAIYTFCVPFIANIISSKKMLSQRPVALLKGLL